MRLHLYLPLVLVLTAGCGPGRAGPADPGHLDAVARRYVILGLSLGRHDPNYVDAYYGPDSLRSAAAADSMSVADIQAAAESLIAELGDSVPSYTDSLVVLRHRYLRVQLGSMAARARMFALAWSGGASSGPNSARLLTAFGWLAAKCAATMVPMEWPTTCAFSTLAADMAFITA